jgi:hypothetical protein
MAAFEWFKTLPIITKSYMMACCITTFAIHLELIKIVDIYLNFQLVYERFEVSVWDRMNRDDDEALSSLSYCTLFLSSEKVFDQT